MKLVTTFLARQLSPVAIFVLTGLIHSSLFAAPMGTFLTGDDGSGPSIFRLLFDPTVPGSGSLSLVATESDPTVRLDNIDFTPGTGFSVVHASAQRPGGGAITQYNVFTGAELPDLVSETSTVAPSAPPSGMSRPATVLPTATHVYYTENQFGFAGTDHRIMRTPFAGPVDTADVVYDAAADGLDNLSGLEIIGSRLYFFAHDAGGASTDRGLYSIGLNGVGVTDGSAAVLEVGGLTGAGGGDGSDELDYDPFSGRLYGTNMISGEIIAFVPGGTPGTGATVSSPTAGPLFLVDPAEVLADGDPTDGAGLLSRAIDGIRPDGAGNLIVVGHDGVVISLLVDGVGGILAVGANDTNIFSVFDDPSIEFDDHTLLAPASALVPEPASVLLWAIMLAAALFVYRRPRL